MSRASAHPSPVLGILLLVACSEPLSLDGIPSRTFSVRVGQELDLTLQTVGPGTYQSPPTISSSSLRFLDMTFVGPPVPAGPTQRYRFKAEAPGHAVILFQHSGNNLAVSDTVEVH